MIRRKQVRFSSVRRGELKSHMEGFIFSMTQLNGEVLLTTPAGPAVCQEAPSDADLGMTFTFQGQMYWDKVEWV